MAPKRAFLDLLGWAIPVEGIRPERERPRAVERSD